MILDKTGLRGKFIVVEGIDGAGTTTMSKRLVDRINSHYGNRVAQWHREPTGSETGLLIRRALRGEAIGIGAEELALLYIADRVGHNAIIREQLSEGTCVVCDRYSPSTFAYQNKVLQWETLNKFVFSEQFTVKPDLMLLLTVSAEMAHERIVTRDKAELFDGMSTQRACARSYAWFAATAQNYDWTVESVDSSESIEATWEGIQAALARRLGVQV